MPRRTFGVPLIEHQCSAYWIDTDIIWSIGPAHAILTYARPERLTWAVSEEAVRPYTRKALLQFAKTSICGLRLKKDRNKTVYPLRHTRFNYVTSARIGWLQSKNADIIFASHGELHPQHGIWSVFFNSHRGTTFIYLR